MADFQTDPLDEQGGGITLREIVGTARDYRNAILLAALAVTVASILAIVAVVVLSGFERVTTLNFRTEFKGAEKGEYPNGTKFSPSEIVSTPVLLSVYKSNGLSEVVEYETFKNSIFVVEDNPALESIDRAYRARLAEPKLSPVDRERLEQEYQQKRASIPRADFAITYLEPIHTRSLPAARRAKILSDILSTWAAQTVQAKGVVLYDLPILSSTVFEQPLRDGYDYVIALDMVRAKIHHIIQNIDALAVIPGSNAIRTRKGNVSLAELRVRLDDTIKFRIEPLIRATLSESLSRNRPEAVAFVQSRLKFNEVERREAEARVEMLHRALTAYVEDASVKGQTSPTSESPTQTIIPQVDESFLQRLADMTSAGEDFAFRQALVEQIKDASLAAVPLRAEQDYYRVLLDGLDGDQVRLATPAELNRLRDQVGDIVRQAVESTDQMNEIYEAISKNLNPSTVMYSTTGPPVTANRAHFAINRLLLLALLAILATFPLAIVVSLFHQRFTAASTGREPSGPEA